MIIYGVNVWSARVCVSVIIWCMCVSVMIYVCDDLCQCDNECSSIHDCCYDYMMRGMCVHIC